MPSPSTQFLEIARSPTPGTTHRSSGVSLAGSSRALASLVTVHCLRRHDFIPTGPGQHKTHLSLLRHVARASFDIPQNMSEMSCLMYLDFEQVLLHDAVSQPVRRRWVVAVVTQDQDDVLS